MLSSRQLLIASATLDVRLKSDILTFVLSRKRLKSVKSSKVIKRKDKKLFCFENGNK